MARFTEADARLFYNKFVCRRCKSKIRAPSRKIAEKLVSCRACATKDFKPKRKK
ncbi:50S ribosomal protein L40e [Candidatus Woesearchaeota archaeon CG10_big_fil_rev_8_21_14_0_10_37_12]|nr:MAG: 50S ribosomal protein L40e [Candidatus Woesearchaeota archaeon CG10_big_fil_rev_8_21_14_0_10_37_12]